MTDGIIQKVIRKYWNDNRDDRFMLEALAEELIAQILTTDLMPETWSKPEYSRMLNRLIGDNE